MGILEYIRNKKQIQHEETAYPLDKIHIAYSSDGEFVKAFVFNNNNTAIKDLETDKVVKLPLKMNIQDNEDLQALYGVSDLKQLTLSYCLSQYAETGDRLPGKALSGLRQEIRANARRSEYDIFMTTSQDIIMQGTWKKGFATNTQLQPVLAYLSQKIAKRHQEYECSRQRTSDYNDKVTSVLEF